jgi:FkbM family methyltransferase
VFNGGLSQRLGIYEHHAQQTFFGLLASDDRVFDIGAHRGFFSLLGSRVVGPRGEVVACEPNPSIIPILQSNLESNHALNVTIVEAAATDRDGPVRLICAPGAPTTEAHLATDVGTGGTMVDGVTLDELARHHGVPSMIKIDVEGFADSVLRGGRRLLSQRDAPNVLIEIHSRDEELGCRDLLPGWSLDYLEPMNKDRPYYPRHLLADRSIGRGSPI